jgi:hypothetical protein
VLDVVVEEMRSVALLDERPTEVEMRGLSQMLYIKAWVNPEAESKAVGGYIPKRGWARARHQKVMNHDQSPLPFR